jgi:peroxiredoxin
VACFARTLIPKFPLPGDGKATNMIGLVPPWWPTPDELDQRFVCALQPDPAAPGRWKATHRMDSGPIPISQNVELREYEEVYELSTDPARVQSVRSRALIYSYEPGLGTARESSQTLRLVRCEPITEEQAKMIAEEFVILSPAVELMLPVSESRRRELESPRGARRMWFASDYLTEYRRQYRDGLLRNAADEIEIQLQGIQPIIPEVSEEGLAPAKSLVGKAAPDFTLQDIYNEPITLSDLRGRPVFVRFLGGPTEGWQQQLIILDEVQRAFDRTQFAIVAVQASPDLAEATIRDFVTRHNLACFVLLGGQAVAREKFGVRATPMTFWIDAEGKVVGVQHGWLTADELTRQAREMLGR